MIRQISKLLFGTLRLLLLFIACTVLFYYGIIWINQEYENYRRYDEPEGRAVKAFNPDEANSFDWFSRLLLFYQNGE